MHDVTTSRAEPVRDSEGLLVTSTTRVYHLTCNTCGWSATADSPDTAIELENVHKATP